MFNKYIILKKGNVPILFPREPLTHLQVAVDKENVKSAGYYLLYVTDGKICVSCFGSSSTLEINSNPTEDKKIIEDFILNKL